MLMAYELAVSGNVFKCEKHFCLTTILELRKQFLCASDKENVHNNGTVVLVVDHSKKCKRL